MKRREARQGQLDRLAMRICAGEVVFFIGAGFSLDSEENSAQLLVARLLARIEALTELTAKSGDAELAELGDRLRTGLRTTFSLEKSANGFSNLFDTTVPAGKSQSVLSATLSSLAQNYYLINDWACSAFENLIDRFATSQPSKEFFTAVQARENELLHEYQRKAKLNPIDIDPIDVEWLLELRKHSVAHPDARGRIVAGKALFLETLGFPSEQVMCGKPMHAELDEVISNSTRVRARHHVLAWLAAEGLTPTVVTTNYDLLLECAFRMAGMLPLSPPPELWTDLSENPLMKARRLKLPLNRRYRSFTRVKDAADFFTYGDAHGSATIHKIHGDVGAYRVARGTGDAERFRKLLPTIVFTFREIQNWREDSWSRDYLSTLLRTRTIVFAGYGVADQVIHDTFRTVYEEIATYRARGAGRAAPAASRAFFTDVEHTRSFHGLEILRASSRAAGETGLELTEHPNLLTFYLKHERMFPHLDELFTWTYHLVARELQAQALEAEVGRIAYQLFEKPCPEEEAKAIVGSFLELRTRERFEAARLEHGSQARCGELARRRFRRLTNWTSVFHRRLMRQYQVAEGLHRNPSEAFAIHSAARYPWYVPLSEHPQWAAWGAILEMAIRRLAGAYLGGPKLWQTSSANLEVAEHAAGPAVLYRARPWARSDTEPPIRRSLSIELGAERLFPRQTPRRLFTALKPKVWELRPETIPWWMSGDGRKPKDTPGARTLWAWAAFGADRSKDSDAAGLLGDLETK